jgi:hypothetical protein
VLFEGLTVERGTLSTTVLGGGVAIRSIPAARGIDSFADSALPERGTLSSSLELNKAKVSEAKRS